MTQGGMVSGSQTDATSQPQSGGLHPLVEGEGWGKRRFTNLLMTSSFSIIIVVYYCC